LTTWNNDLSDISDNTLIQPGTELFRSASSLKKGQRVSFSGSFVPAREGCISESSITLRGKLDDPDFIFRFSSVAPYVSGQPPKSRNAPDPIQPADDYKTTIAPQPSAASISVPVLVCSDVLVIHQAMPPDDKRGPPARMTTLVVVDENGTATEVLFPSVPEIQAPDKALADAWIPAYQSMIKENLAQWKFQPSLCNGSPTRKTISIEFNFHYRQ
jgi:hypothetical protein